MATVKPIPDGYTTITPFLNIKGAAEAIDFYKKAFGAEEQNRFTTPAGAIAICILKFGNALVRVSDAVNDPPTTSGLAMYVENADQAWSRAVDAGCEIVFPLQNMFFGDRFGILRDPYGNRWSIAQHVEDVSPEEMRRREPEAMRAFQRT